MRAGQGMGMWRGAGGQVALWLVSAGVALAHGGLSGQSPRLRTRGPVHLQEGTAGVLDVEFQHQGGGSRHNPFAKGDGSKGGDTVAVGTPIRLFVSPGLGSAVDGAVVTHDLAEVSEAIAQANVGGVPVEVRFGPGVYTGRLTLDGVRQLMGE